MRHTVAFIVGALVLAVSLPAAAQDFKLKADLFGQKKPAPKPPTVDWNWKPLTQTRASADYARDFAQFDEETITAVDKFRADRNLNYQGNPAGLVDARLIDALRAAYFDKKKAAAKR